MYICSIYIYMCIYICIVIIIIYIYYTQYTVQHHWLEVHAIPTIPWFHNMSSRKASKLWFRNLAESKCLGFFTSRRLSHHSGIRLFKVNPSFLDQLGQPRSAHQLSAYLDFLQHQRWCPSRLHRAISQPRLRSWWLPTENRTRGMGETMGNPYSQKTIPSTNHWEGIYHGIPYTQVNPNGGWCVFG